MPSSLDYAVATATLALCYLPQSWGASSATDLSGNGVTGTYHGSPSVDVSGGVQGVVLDSVSKYIEFSLSIQDEPVTMFTVTRGASSSAGVRKMIVELTDDQGTIFDRSISISDAFGGRKARANGNDSGDASYTFSDAGTFVHRARFSNVSRSLCENGAVRASSAAPATTRSVVRGRIGQYVAGILPWDGVFCALLIYTGNMSLLDEEKVDRQLRALTGASDPFSWPIQASTDLVSDPRFILPATIPAIVGQQVQIWKDSIHYRDGVDPSQTAICQIPFDPAPNDRWAFTPTAAGSFSFTVAESGFTATSTVIAVPMLAANAAKRVILYVGDSITNRGGAGFIQYVGDTLGASRVQMVGLNGPASGFSYKHQGTDSTRWSDFNTNASSVFGGPSPFFHNGVLDIAHYISLLDAAPDIIIWGLGTNDVTEVMEAQLDAHITDAFATADTLFAAWTAQLPNVKHVLCTNYPLAMDPATGWGTSAARLTGRRQTHRYVERVQQTYGGREAEKLYVMDCYFHLDPIRGYFTTDSRHPNSSPGGEQQAACQLAFLVSIW